MKSVKARNLWSFILNLFTAVLVSFSIAWFFSEEGLQSGAGNMNTGGYGCLVYFTNLSNILVALSSLLVVPFNLKAVRCGQDYIPKIIRMLKFIGTTAVTVTLVVVLVFLGPVIGYHEMFEGNCLYLHLFCPLMAIASFCFFECGYVFTKKEALWGILPTFLYANVYLRNVIFTDTWIDFYHFNLGGMWYVSYSVMLVATYLLARILRYFHNRTEEQK